MRIKIQINKHQKHQNQKNNQKFNLKKKINSQIKPNMNNPLIILKLMMD